jgi:hypothetical protein
MYFEGRETTPYQDPIDSTSLKEGTVCYVVSLDDNTPLITSFYFIGTNLEAEDSQGEDMLYFQDSTSYFAGIRYGSEDPSSAFPTTFLKQPVSNPNGIYDLESALQILMYYSLKQKNKRAS